MIPAAEVRRAGIELIMAGEEEDVVVAVVAVVVAG